MTNKEDQDLTIYLNPNKKQNDKHPDWRMSKKDEASGGWDNLAVAWNGVSKGKDGKPDRNYIKVGLSVALVTELYAKIAKPAPQIQAGDYVNPDDLPF